MKKYSNVVNTGAQVVFLLGALILSGDSYALGVKGYSSYHQTYRMRDEYKKKALMFAESALKNAKIGHQNRAIEFVQQARENSRFVISDFTGATSQKIHVRFRKAVSAIKNDQMEKAVNFLQEAVAYLKRI